MALEDYGQLILGFAALFLLAFRIGVYLGRKERKMIIEQVVCDGCGALKGDANHWFAVESTVDDKGLTLWPIDEVPDADASTVKHLCGTQCALKYIRIPNGETCERNE